jgi:hypothetical protein
VRPHRRSRRGGSPQRLKVREVPGAQINSIIIKYGEGWTFSPLEWKRIGMYYILTQVMKIR